MSKNVNQQRSQGLIAKSRGPRPRALTEAFRDRILELEDLGFKDPIQVLMEIATGAKIDVFTGRLQPLDSKMDARAIVMAASELCSYTYPKLKSVELSGNDGQPILFAVQQDFNGPPLLNPVKDEMDLLMGTENEDEDPPTITAE